MLYSGQSLIKSTNETSATIAPAPTEPPSARPRIVAGTSNGFMVFDAEPTIALEGHDIQAIAATGDALWAIADQHTIWYRDRHQDWQPVANVDDWQLHCLLPLDKTVLIGTSGACLLRLTDGTLTRLKGFEAAEGREAWYTPWGGPPDVRSLAVGQSGEWYANVHVGGILRSNDQGQTWHPTLDFHADVHEVRTMPEHPDWVVAATAEGLAISQDQGHSWRFDRAHLHAPYARAVAISAETILMSASTGPRTSQAALYRRALQEAGSFEKCTQGLPEWFADNINTGTLAASGKFAAFGTNDGRIFLSDDTGLTWRQMAAVQVPIRCLHLFSPSHAVL